MGVPLWIGIVHDWTKYLPIEWGAYVRQFFNSDGTDRKVRDSTGAYDPAKQEEEFRIAWTHHERLKHHWQAWVCIGDRGTLEPIPIPEVYVREMIADWIGAGIAYSGKANPIGWYEANKDKMIFHPQTTILIETLIKPCG